MTAAIVALPEMTDSREALLPVLGELHALITIDPMMGVTPVRVLFVLKPDARAQVAASIDPVDVHGRRGLAYALVAYDFPFALHQFTTSRNHIADDRAKAIITASAASQAGCFCRAAERLALEVRPVPSFDAAALKAVFFPSTQETVTHLFRLSPAGA
jgi:hypothetical protein